jgi:large subunit ribosomal protein L21
MVSAVRREETQQMYAVVETGGKQYSAMPGGFIDVEKLLAEVGEQVTFDQVLLIVDGESVMVGKPTVTGATVTATVVGQRRRRKVLYFHYVPKKRERKRHGHRQPYTRLRIESIQA